MLNPFLAPLTPPRPERSRTLALLPPTTQIPIFQTPSTPRKNAASGQLATPSTGTRYKNALKTPQTSRKGALFSSRDSSLLPPTPEFTPQRSPKSHRKKKTAAEDILRTPSQSAFDAASQSPPRTSEFSFGLFLPTPSTVGTGRKISTAPLKALRTPAILSFSTLAKLNENLHFEEDDSDTTPLLHDLKSSPPLEEASKPLLQLSTPKGQLIDDTKVNYWHGKSFNSKFDSDDESDGEIIVPQVEVVNPFISNTDEPVKPTRAPINPFASPTQHSKSVDYSTHVEYVNNRTGERRIVKLLEKQSQIKPKRLNFANI